MGLLWCGNIVYLWKRAIRPLAFMYLPDKALPLERCMCPINQVFEYHRNNEFMFLMLGESVLQMVISLRYKEPDNFGDSIWSQHNFLIVCSFIIAWSMLVSFRHMVEQQIEEAEEVNGEVEQEQQEQEELEEALGMQKEEAHGHGHGHGHGNGGGHGGGHGAKEKRNEGHAESSIAKQSAPPRGDWHPSLSLCPPPPSVPSSPAHDPRPALLVRRALPLSPAQKVQSDLEAREAS